MPVLRLLLGLDAEDAEGADADTVDNAMEPLGATG